MNRACVTLSTKLLAVGLVLAASGCGGDSALGPNQGRVHFVLSSGGTAGAVTTPQSTASTLSMSGQDAAATSPSLNDSWDGESHDYRFFQTANVTFSSILARNQSGELVNVEMDLPASVDVVSMDGGNQVSLPDGTLTAGTYDQLVVVMTQVDGVAHDGTQISFTPPGGGWTAIVPICPFSVEDGGSTTVSLQFMLRQAFQWRNSRFHFQPQFQCDSGSGG